MLTKNKTEQKNRGIERSLRAFASEHVSTVFFYAGSELKPEHIHLNLSTQTLVKKNTSTRKQAPDKIFAGIASSSLLVL